jgi:hypothetical protein
MSLDLVTLALAKKYADEKAGGGSYGEYATEEYVDNAIANIDIPSGGSGENSLGITGATVGQIAQIAEVDAEGKPVEWEAIDAKDGINNNEWQKIGEVTVTNLVFEITDYTDGLFTVEGIKEAVAETYTNRITLRKKDYSSYSYHYFKVNDNGKIELTNLDLGAQSPSIDDINNYVFELGYITLIRIYGTDGFEFLKIRLRAPHAGAHGARAWISNNYAGGLTPNEYNWNGHSFEYIVETSPANINNKMWVTKTVSNNSNHYKQTMLQEYTQVPNPLEISYWIPWFTDGTFVEVWGK